MLGYDGLLPGFDEYTYRYYIPGPVGDGKCSSTITNLSGGRAGQCDREDSKCCLSTVPIVTHAFPYTIGCFKGCTLG